MQGNQNNSNNVMTYVGMGLIFLLLYLWMQYAAPPKKDVPANAATAPTGADTLVQTATPAPAAPVAVQGPPDSTALNRQFGAFAPAATGQEQFVQLENDAVRITLSSKGGRIREVFLKNYFKINSDTAGKDVTSPVRLLEDAKNRFQLQIPVQYTATGSVNSADLYFQVQQTGNTVVFRAPTSSGGFLEQSYSLAPDNAFQLDYKITTAGLDGVLPQGPRQLRLEWDNYLDKLEKNQQYERNFSTVYFAPQDESADYLNCRKNDTKSLGAQPVRWIGHSNQFFNTTLIAQDFHFTEFTGTNQMYTDPDPDLKLLKTTAVIPLNNPSVTMTLYSGPNEFGALRGFKVGLEDMIPFGASLFGFINRWVIHPMFDFLLGFIANKGLVILALTLLVKLLLYPLTYRMVYSQARMASLKPQIDALRKKHGDDQQAMSVETMKLYSEFRVNPLGGCLPIFFQMPIWFALYRFFPAAIEFRQAGFLWATDLSSYDDFIKLPFYLTGFGHHISLFTLIWVATTLWYTWYSMKQMDPATMGANPAMKYMQYFMPVVFMFFFNSFASGLTVYLVFSNILNIAQTVVTKQYIIDHDKIKLQLEANRLKPKKTGGWRERFEQAMKEQQRVQADKTKKKPK